MTHLEGIKRLLAGVLIYLEQEPTKAIHVGATACAVIFGGFTKEA